MDSKLLRVVAAIGSVIIANSLKAEILYSENFDEDPTSQWIVNLGPGTHAANFYFDYSTVGIPPAPNANGTTRGLKLEANYTGNVFGGLSVSPAGQNFTGDYVLLFDLWINFLGPLPGGGSGSTQITGAGIGSTGTNVQWIASSPQNSVFFGVTGDGGSSSDYRAFSSAAPTGYSSGNAVYQAPSGSNNSSDAYYAPLGTNSVPAAQTALFAEQIGTTAAGAPGFRWHAGRIIKSGNTATFTVSDLPIAVIDLTTVTLGGGNILFTHWDVNGTSSTSTNVRSLQFGLIDNVVVKRLHVFNDVSKLPDGRLQIVGTGVPGMTYKVQAAADLSSLLTASSIGDVVPDGNGDFVFVDSEAQSHTQRFYRLKSP